MEKCREVATSGWRGGDSGLVESMGRERFLDSCVSGGRLILRKFWK